jgi:uncharacterized membrane protein
MAPSRFITVTIMDSSSGTPISPRLVRAFLFFIPAILTVGVIKVVLDWVGELSSWVHLYLSEWESTLPAALQWAVHTGVSLIALLVVIAGLWVFGSLLGIGVLNSVLTGIRNTIFRAFPGIDVVFGFFEGFATKISDMLAQREKMGVPCLVEYTQPGVWVQGFLTKVVKSTVTDQKIGVVEVYTAPNPIGGVIVWVPVEKIRLCRATVQEAVEFSISLGTVASDSLVDDVSRAIAGVPTRDGIPQIPDLETDDAGSEAGQ